MSTGGSPRDRLLQAARDVVAADGLEGLTLRAIARRAGVSHGAPLRHFPTLAALLAAVAADGFARLVATIDDTLAEADRAAAATGARLGPRQRLAIAGQAYVSFALADPGVFSVTFRPERVDVTDAEYQLRGAASFRQLVDLVEAAQAGGWQPDHRPEDLAAVLWAQVHGLAELALHGALDVVVRDGDLGDLGDGDDPVDRLTALATSLAVGADTILDLGPATVPPSRQGDPR